MIVGSFMKGPSFFLAATIVQSWFKGKIDLLMAPTKTLRKSKDFLDAHHYLWIKIPYINPVIRKLSLSEFYFAKVKEHKKSHTFCSSLETQSHLHLLVDSSEGTELSNASSDEKVFPKHVLDAPFKEHLLATKRLDQASVQYSSSKKDGFHSISIFLSETSQESKEPLFHDWTLQRQEERQFQIDRVIKRSNF